MKTGHTPTPIRINPQTLTLVDKDGKFLTVRELEFIVHAVNSHAALLEAVKRALEASELDAQHDEYFYRAVIAQADGKS